MELLNKISALENEASEFGFNWENSSQIMEQIYSECREIQTHLDERNLELDRDALQEEIGDLLHAVFSLCVFHQYNPKETLENTLMKFERRLQAVKKIALENNLHSLKGLDFAELMTYWNKAKTLVG